MLGHGIFFNEAMKRHLLTFFAWTAKRVPGTSARQPIARSFLQGAQELYTRTVVL
jgi:hypothetical protein